VRTDRYGNGARWLAVWHEADGTRRRKAFTSKDAATAHLEHVGVQQREGTYVSPAASAVTVREVAERWFGEQVHQRASSLQTIRRRLDRTLLPVLGELRLSQPDRSAVQGAVTAWSKSSAPGTVRLTYVYLAGICTLAVEERRLVQTPCRRINLPADVDERVVPLRVEQVQALVDVADERYRSMFVLAAASGLRSGELRGRTWDRITATAGGGVVRVDRQLTRAAVREAGLGGR